MTEEKKQRIQILAHQIIELIENEDCYLFDAIDAVACVEAHLLNKIRTSAKKTLVDSTTELIKSLTLKK